MDPSVALSGYFVPQGISADLIATKFGYGRNDVDNFALNSQQRAANALLNNYFKESVIPVRDINGFVILDKDENPRPETTLETLSALEPSFSGIGEFGGFDAVALDKYPEVEKINHVHHAGNSSAIVDGSGIALIGSKSAGEKMGIKPRAKIKSLATYGTDPTIMLVGPAPASRLALSKSGMQKSDIDLFEINEAFAAVVLRFMEDLGVDHSIVNVNGGAISLGHPLGATGCMILGTALDELERRDLNTALVSLCIGGGMGIATIIERC
jgi:acetyl-CoA C-acetyltransferase